MDNKILVYVDQDNDGTVEWLREEKVDFILNTAKECQGIGFAYDTMFSRATTDLVVAFHADMILGLLADKYMYDAHQRGTVVCATRIEPPIHPPGPEKITMDLGNWPEQFNWDEFDKFVTVNSTKDSPLNKVTSGMFAPWLIDRRDHLGHDPMFKSVYEDADLFRRFVLSGYKLKQVWQGLVYHFTCRGGQFEHAVFDIDLNFKSRSPQWEHNNLVSFREYVRKWGGPFREYGPCEPRPNIKYNIGLKVEGSTHRINVNQIEPHFDQLVVPQWQATQYYIKDEQTRSRFNLAAKFVDQLTTDIQVVINTDHSQAMTLLAHFVDNVEQIVSELPLSQPVMLQEQEGSYLVIVKNKARECQPMLNLTSVSLSHPTTISTTLRTS